MDSVPEISCYNIKPVELQILQSIIRKRFFLLVSLCLSSQVVSLGISSDDLNVYFRKVFLLRVTFFHCDVTAFHRLLYVCDSVHLAVLDIGGDTAG